MIKKKLLVSPGFGAGWSTWASTHAKELAEDEKLIELVEAEQHIIPGASTWGADYGVTTAFADRCLEIVGKKGDMPYMGGVYQLEVEEVGGQYRIMEYDGSESLEEPSNIDWW